MAQTVRLTDCEVRIIDEVRKVARLANEWKVEIIGGTAHSRTTYSIRPTPYYRLESKDGLSLAVDD